MLDLRRIRRARDQTLKDISTLSGLSIGYLSKIEHGIVQPSSLSYPRAIALARAYRVPVEAIMPDEAEAPV